MTVKHTRLNIYLDPPELRDLVRLAALRRGQTASAWCVDAILDRLRSEGLSPPDPERARRAAEKMDAFRKQVGPIGINVTDLINEGRRR